jgi:hypothetical protein
MADNDNSKKTLSKDITSFLRRKNYSGLIDAVTKDPSLATAGDGTSNNYTLLCLLADDDNVPENEMGDMVTLLLKNGADLSAQSQDGAKNTAMHLALGARNIYFIRAVKKAAPDKIALFSTVKNGNDETALEAFAAVNSDLAETINLIELYILLKS